MYRERGRSQSLAIKRGRLIERREDRIEIVNWASDN